MNPAQIHLALNHFPIAGGFIALLLLVWGLWSKKDDIKCVATIFVVFSALTALPVFFSGEGAEEIVEHKPLVTEEVIKPHEEAAEAATVLWQISAVLAIAWLVLQKKKAGPEKAVYFSVILFVAITSLMMAKSAHLGGMIRHDELREVTPKN